MILVITLTTGWAQLPRSWDQVKEDGRDQGSDEVQTQPVPERAGGREAAGSVVGGGGKRCEVLRESRVCFPIAGPMLQKGWQTSVPVPHIRKEFVEVVEFSLQVFYWPGETADMVEFWEKFPQRTSTEDECQAALSELKKLIFARASSASGWLGVGTGAAFTFMAASGKNWSVSMSFIAGTRQKTEEFFRRWEGRAEVLPLFFFPFLLVRVRNVSSLAEGEVYSSRHPSCGCRAVSQTSTGDGCLFLLETTTPPTQNTFKKQKKAKMQLKTKSSEAKRSNRRNT